MPTAPTSEPLVGERGQQRDRAAEQHREQVERDRAEHDRLAADEPESLDAPRRGARALPGRSTASAVTVTGTDGTRATGSAGPRARARRSASMSTKIATYGSAGVGGVEEPAEHRPEDRARSATSPTSGRRPRAPGPAATMSAGNARAGGSANARAVPKTNAKAKIGRDRRRLGREVDEERDGDGRLRDVRPRDDPASIEAVGDRARHEHEERGRRERGETEEAEVERAAADREDLDPEHGVERRRRHRAQQEAREQRDDRPAGVQAPLLSTPGPASTASFSASGLGIQRLPVQPTLSAAAASDGRAVPWWSA